MLGASGAVEAVASALAVSRGVLPPTHNLDDPDPDCDLDHVRHAARADRDRQPLCPTRSPSAATTSACCSGRRKPCPASGAS